MTYEEFHTDDLAELTEFYETTLFSSIDFKSFDMTDVTFEECRFSGCSFDEVLLASTNFTDCSFNQCSFVLTKFDNTALHDVHFKECKLVGIDFTYCNEFLFALEFTESILDNIFLANRKMKKTGFTKCTIAESDFRYVDFSEANFSKTTFRNVLFRSCNLQKADFRTAEGYLIDPEQNSLKNALFTLPEAQSFLGFLGIKIDS